MRTICLALFITKATILAAQEDTTGLKPSFFNQVNLSMNYSDTRWYEKGENLTSVGIGLYRNLKDRKGFQLRWGIELNRVRQVGPTPLNVAGIIEEPFQSTIFSLDVPLVLKYSFGERVKWVPEVGFYLANNMSNRITGSYERLTGDSINTIEKFNYNQRKVVSPFNVGASIGLGVVFPSGSYSYELKADYRFGFNDVGLGAFDSPLYSRYFRLSLGMIFHEKAKNNPITSEDSSADWINEYSVSVNNNDIASYSNKLNKTGIGFGLYHNSKEIKGFSSNLGFEINHTNYYGGLVTSRTMNWYSHMDVSMTALTIPFSLRYHIGKRFRIFPEAGVFVEFNSRARGEGQSYSVTGNQIPYTTTVSNFNETVALKKINYGVTAGVGVLVPIGKNHILLKAEYRYGQLELTTGNYRMGIYNRYIRFSAGYSLDMVKKATAKKIQLVNEIRTSLNYGAMILDYLPLYNENFITKPQIGYGIGIYRTTKERKNFQYIVGIELDLLRMTLENQYIRSYNGKVEETQSKSTAQSLFTSLNNGLRYYIGNKGIRPFIQIGIAPEFKVMIDTRDNFIVSNLTTGEVEEFNYKYNGVKIWDVYLTPNLGLGCVIKGSEVDYVVMADYKNSTLLAERSWRERPNYLRLSLGIRLHERK